MNLFYEENEAYETMLEISYNYASPCWVEEWADGALIVARSPTGKVYGIKVPVDKLDPKSTDYRWFHEAS